MFAITAKVKIAAGIAAGALALGAAGAYAAGANNTVTVQNTTPIPLPNGGPTLVSVTGKSLPTTLPTFANHGACISFFAKNRDFALAPKSGTTVSKNYHGKLISGLQSWCDSQVKATTTTSTAETQTSDAAQTGATDSTDTSDSQNGASNGQGHGHGHGHGHSASETD